LIKNRIFYNQLLGNKTSTTTTISFYRKLNTGDTSGDLIVTSSNMNVLWAFGASDGTTTPDYFPQHISKGSATINFITGTSFSTINNIIEVHAILMIISWAIFIVMGSFIARYMKNILKKWFLVHAFLQVSAGVMATCAFIIAIYSTYKNGEIQFNGTHQQFGLTIMIALYIQLVVGYLSNKYFDSNRKKPPIWPDKIHWYLGRGLTLCAIINIILGLILYGAAQKYIIVACVYLGLLVLIVIVQEFANGQSHETSEKKRKKS